MKQILLTLFVFPLLAAPLNAQQAYYPLHIGDTWQYFQILFPDPIHPFVDVQQTTVTGDTLMPNGHHYSIMSGWWWYNAFVRQEGDSLLRWTPYGEVLQFDFSRPAGDSIISSAGQLHDTVIVHTLVRDTVTTWGVLTFKTPRRTWSFALDNPIFVDDEQWVYVIDSLGIVMTNAMIGPYEFKGAKINGIIYGNFTGSSEQQFYPLRPGNSWSYRTFHSNYPNAPDSSTSRREVVKDVRMQNGKTYSQLNLPDIIGGQFIREDSNYVYYYSPYDTAEVPMYDLKAGPGTANSIRFGGLGRSTVVSISEQMVLGRMRVVREYSLDGLVQARVRLASGLGIIQAWDYGDGGWPYVYMWDLRGAIVDDTLHGTLLAVEESEVLPRAYSLEQNYPNPFNPSTTIRYALPQRSRVSLTVFNTLGQEVATLIAGEVEAGYHEVRFNGSGLASGVYFYRIQTGNFTQTRSLLLVK